MKTMFALLLIAGIVMAAQCGPAFAGEAGMRASAAGQDWWQTRFGRHLSARPFADVPWLDQVSRGSRQDRPLLPRIDTLDRFRLPFGDLPTQVTASGQLHT
jgi:hypothetical protein